MPTAPSPVCEVRDLGRVAYAEARRLQDRLAGEIADGRLPPTLLLLEHPHTYTFGRRARPEDLLWSNPQLAARKVEIQWIDRGGEATYHGPGQLVGYPILPLGRVARDGRLPQTDYIGYLRRLEDVIIRAVARLGLAAGQLPGLTGVWVQPDVASRCTRCPPAARRSASKLASIGVKVDSHGVTRHGFALNIDPDMSYWEGIVACGHPDRPAVALADLLQPAPEAGHVRRAVVDAFGAVFGFDMVPAP